MRKCSDGTEYEITEIRGPKASGFFYFLKFLLYECKNEKMSKTDSRASTESESTPTPLRFARGLFDMVCFA